MKIQKMGFMFALACAVGLAAQAFEGRIEAVQVRGDQAQHYVWQVGANRLSIVRTQTNQPEISNLVALDTGEITFVFPYNRSYVRYRPEQKSQTPDGLPDMPMPPGGLPPGIGPQSGAAGGMETPAAPNRIGPSGFSGLPEMPAIPVNPTVKMPEMPAGMPPNIGPSSSAQPNPVSLPAMAGLPEGMEMPEMPEGMEMPGFPGHPMAGAKRTLRRGEVEFTATGETTNLLGCTCSRYEIRDRRNVMEVWATDQLIPFHPWQPNVPPRDILGRKSVDENWAELLQERKLFPLIATLKTESGESILFEFKVSAITPEKGGDETLFQPPADYHEMHVPRF